MAHSYCSLQQHSKWVFYSSHIENILKEIGRGVRDRTPRQGQALRWRSSSQDVTGCWLEDAQEGLGRLTKTALQLQGVVFQAPASPLAAAQRALACIDPRPERQGSKVRSFIYSGCCWGLGISCQGEEGKKNKSFSFLSSCGLQRNTALSSTVVHTLVSAIALAWYVCTCVCLFLCVSGSALRGPVFSCVLHSLHKYMCLERVCWESNRSSFWNVVSAHYKASCFSLRKVSF